MIYSMKIESSWPTTETGLFHIFLMKTLKAGISKIVVFALLFHTDGTLGTLQILV